MKITEAELAEIHGVTTSEVMRHRQNGMPASQEGGVWVYDVDEVQDWVDANQSFQKRTSPKHDPAAPAEIVAAIAAARTPAELATVGQQAAALVAAGKMSPTRGRAIQSLLSGSRAARVVGGSEDDVQAMLYATEQGAQLLEMFEGIISGIRRRRVMDTVTAVALRDSADFPPSIRDDPEAVTKKLAELGLDKWGEAIDAGV